MDKSDFSDEDKIKSLLCCDRHCCLCDKQCSTGIEIHHILPKSEGGNSSFDNAIPLCFDCHAKVEAYNKKQSMGTKYRYDELKKRRNQIYDKYTSPLVPNIHFEIISSKPEGKPKEEPHKPTDARFSIFNTHQYLGCKVKLIFNIYNPETKKKIYGWEEGIYGGQTPWILNPNSGGNFPPNFLHVEKMPKEVDSLQVQIEAIIIDKFNWEHPLLPVSWIWTKNVGWYFHPFLIE